MMNQKNSFYTIAQLWSVYLDKQLNSSDVAAMMALLKIVRIQANQQNKDSWLDLAGYAACGWEVSNEVENREDLLQVSLVMVVDKEMKI